MTKNRRTSNLLFVAALGVVFGDLGTSPLYTFSAVFNLAHIAVTTTAVTGIVSLIFWAILLVVCVQYVLLIMRADNQGEGGVMALIGLLNGTKLRQRKKTLLVLCALVGVSLFYGDSVITPAISVLSAVEGVGTLMPNMQSYVVPIAVAVLLGLFLFQSRGTQTIGRYFGPIMLLWFVVSAIGGLIHIIGSPQILSALWPGAAVNFISQHPGVSLVILSGVVLAVTGAEALYADMGHFSRKTIAKAWFFIVFPALILTYLGQGAQILQSGSIENAYFSLFPLALQPFIVLLAMAATLIASQAVVSGAFSLTRQAIHLGFAPRLLVRHTSASETGQIYIPSLNWLLAFIVITLVISFASSTQLAGAFGMAVSAAILIDGILFMVLSITRKHRLAAVCMFALVVINACFVIANIGKVSQGAWLPLGLALLSFILLSTWRRGKLIVNAERKRIEGTLTEFVSLLHRSNIERTKGSAVYIGHHAGNAPLALHNSLTQLHELHENVVIVTVITEDIAHVPVQERIIFDELGYPDDGISHITLRFGYMETPNVPRALESSRSLSRELSFDLGTTTYFVSHGKPVIGKNRKMARWRKYLYLLMDRNVNDTTSYLKLPLERTVEMTTFIEL